MNSLEKQRNFGLDLMRAVAIILVVMAHYPFLFKNQMLGFWGVQTFFSLSGFLIGNILFSRPMKDIISVLEFWKDRWLRTLPNYYVFFGIECYRMNVNPIYAKRYLFFMQGYYPDIFYFYGVSWTLCVEEWFYLLMPLLFLILKNASKNFMGCCLLFLFFCITVIREYLFQNGVQGVFHNPLLKCDGILMGVAVAYIKYSKIDFYLLIERKFVGVMSFVLICFIYVITLEIKIVSPTLLLIYAVLISIMIPSISKIDQFRTKILNKLIYVISVSSYTIYLLHYPFLRLFWSSEDFHQYNFHSGISFVLYFLIVLSISYVWYLSFEKTILRLRTKISFRK